MKTSLVALLLVLANLASGQATPPRNRSAPTAGTRAGQPAAPQAQKKEIKDPAEYNAYVGAVQQTDPAAKISGLEAFLTQYPNSVMKEDALELLMGTYQQANNQAKVIDTANRLLTANPNNARALVLLAYNERAAQKWADAKQHAERGLQAVGQDAQAGRRFGCGFRQAEGPAERLAEQRRRLFRPAVEGLRHRRRSICGPPSKPIPNNVENVYPLALAYLTATPPDDVNGLFFIARAANLVNDPAGKASIIKFGHSRYVKYHGSEEGWDDLLAQTKTTPLPPAGFTITQYVPPTPPQQAADLVKTKKPEEMSFAEWELVLSVGTPGGPGQGLERAQGQEPADGGSAGDHALRQPSWRWRPAWMTSTRSGPTSSSHSLDRFRPGVCRRRETRSILKALRSPTLPARL